jgi:hypothetical protein
MEQANPTMRRTWTRRAALGPPIAVGTTLFGAPPSSARVGATTCTARDAGSAPAPLDCTEDATTMAGIAASLTARADALERDDRDAFLATLDLRNPTWRRIQTEYFDSRHGQRNIVLHGTPVSLQVKPYGYVRATVEFARGASPPMERGSWVFSRDASGVWRHAEPMNEELGPRLLDDRGAFVISHYEWDTDVLDRVAAVAQSAWARVNAILALPTTVRPTVSLNPTYGSHSGLRGATTWAAYLPGTRGIVLLRSPDSYGAGTASVTSTPDAKLLIPLTHEMTHCVNDEVVSLVRVPQWMSEGLAEHVSDHMRTVELATVVRARKTWTLDKASDVIEWGVDPARNYTSADISLAYAHAAHGVRYYIERFGLETFWALSREFATSRTWDRTFQAVSGITWEAFGADWNSWLRDRFP